MSPETNQNRTQPCPPRDARQEGARAAPRGHDPGQHLRTQRRLRSGAGAQRRPAAPAEGHGRNEIIYVQVDGEERPTFIRDIQRNPVTDQILHVDFMQISLKEKVTPRGADPLHRRRAGSRHLGGILTHQLNEIQVEALPTAIPSFHRDRRQAR